MSAGAEFSGDDLESGRDNRSQSTTTVFMGKSDDESYSLGAVFVAGVTRLYHYERPDTQLTGIRGLGWNVEPPSSSNSFPDLGGIGVEGVGSLLGGTGVVGRGGGAAFDQDHNGNQIPGSGGFGVHGIGGTDEPSINYNNGPAPGIVGEGGRRSETGNQNRGQHAAGVVGFGGANSPSEIGFKGQYNAQVKLQKIDTGGAGVFGLGSDMTYNDQRRSGPYYPGPGLVGIGGQEQQGSRRTASGVVGFSGFMVDPVAPDLQNIPYSESSGAGVYGGGVRDSRGGIFASESMGQVRLMPLRSPEDFSLRGPVQANEVLNETGSFGLPKNGLPGDLLALQDTEGRCILWLCVEPASRGGAKWAQLLLGNTVMGDS